MFKQAILFNSYNIAFKNFWLEVANKSVLQENFQGRGGFVELGHFDRRFVKSTKKMAPQGKNLELFLLDSLKTTFRMENSTQKWTQLELFFPKSGHFFHFSKKCQGGLPPSHLVVHLK